MANSQNVSQTIAKIVENEKILFLIFLGSNRHISEENLHFSFLNLLFEKHTANSFVVERF